MLSYINQQNLLQGSQCQDLPLYCPDFGCRSYQRNSMDGSSDQQSLSTTISSPPSETSSETYSEPERTEEKRLQAFKKMNEKLEKWQKEFQVDASDELVIQVVSPLKITNTETINFLADVTRQMDDQKLSFDSLSLNFAKCFNINDQGIKAIAAHIGKHFNHIHSLILNFQSCEKITDKGVIELAQIIGTQFPNLIHFSLDLYDCAKVTDVSVKVVAQVVGRLRSLRRFELNLRQCYKVTGEAIRALSNELRNLENLEVLILNFRLCNKIGDAEIEELAREIKLNLKNLHTLKLNVNYCKISKKVIEALQISFEYLKHFELMF